MGKSNAKKKTGKAAEKTEKKLAQKLKKELKVKGEDEIEAIVAKFAEEDRKKVSVVETLKLPSKRSSFSLTAHPDKDQLILFGGEYFNGTKTILYNELYFYDIKKNKWLEVSSPGGPPPRCSHQAVAISQSGGQLWIFGGEFTSPSQKQFYHYKDLWCFHFSTKKWEKIEGKGVCPSARSGHRMVFTKKHLIVFGGFRDNSRDYKYFDDVHAFSLEDYTWKKLDMKGNGPFPRSASQMAALTDGRVVVYGGYSRQNVKGDIDVGVTHGDMFMIAPDKHDTTGQKFKWQTVKQGPLKPTVRTSFAMATKTGDKAVIFGGIRDEVDEDVELEGECLNDMYQLDLTNGIWTELEIVSKVDRSNAAKPNDAMETDSPAEEQKIVSDDGVFTVTMGPAKKQTPLVPCQEEETEVFKPPPRGGAGLAIKKNTLYLYGGVYEDGDKQLTLDDFYSIDLSKMDEWITLKALDPKDLEWFDSEDEDSEDDDDDDEESSDELD